MVNLFVRALIITTIIVAITDAIVFYVIWRWKSTYNATGRHLGHCCNDDTHAINLWVHIFKQLS